MAVEEEELRHVLIVCPAPPPSLRRRRLCRPRAQSRSLRRRQKERESPASRPATPGDGARAGQNAASTWTHMVGNTKKASPMATSATEPPPRLPQLTPPKAARAKQATAMM